MPPTLGTDERDVITPDGVSLGVTGPTPGDGDDVEARPSGRRRDRLDAQLPVGSSRVHVEVRGEGTGFGHTRRSCRAGKAVTAWWSVARAVGRRAD